MSSANRYHLCRGSALWFLSALIFFTVSLAHAEPKATLKISQVHHEGYKESTPISGNWIVGVHMEAVASKLSPILYSRIPKGWSDNKVCARSTDVSGWYTALIEYEVGPNWEGGLVKLNYSNAYENIVSQLNEDNSGVAIHRGGCDAVTEQFVPAFWNAEESPIVSKAGNIQLVINLNAQRSQQMFARGTVDQIAYTAICSPLANGGTAFNFQCLLEVPKDLAGELKFEVWRVRSGMVSKPRSAMILLGAS